MVLVDEGVYFELLQVIKCDIKPGSVERSRDVEIETISFFLNEKMRQFQKKIQG
jgi:hypothetical protein